MRIFIALGFACLSAAQTTQLAGVWKADLSASQFPGNRAPSQYLEIISQTGSKVTEQTGSWFPFGVSRSELEFDTSSAPIIQAYEGVPSRATAQTTEGKLTVSIETAGQPDTTTRTYEVSADGQHLTVSIQASHGGHQMQSRLALVKQPDSAGEPLRQPPAAAATTYKNLKTPLKELNSEQFIDNMHYFAWALQKNCEFCHVQRDFASDDKKEKRTARAMIAMVNGVDQDTFKGKQEVACFTCHEFRSRPLKRPIFDGEKPESSDEHEGEKRSSATTN